MGSDKKHKHKSKRRKHHRHGSDSDEIIDVDKPSQKHRSIRKPIKDRKKDKGSLSKLVDAYASSGSSDSDDVVIISAPPPPKISKQSIPSPPPAPYMRCSPVSPPARRKSPSSSPQYRRGSDRKHSNALSDGRNFTSSSEISLSVEETNRLRAKLGLKPLEIKTKDLGPKLPTPTSSNDSSLSIADTNILRMKLGLKPLSLRNADLDAVEGTKETHGGVNMGDFVHKPAENVLDKKKAEKLREKIIANREKRNMEEKLARVKGLAESDSDDDDDARKWVKKNRIIVSEKEKAEKRAKELDDMDEVFGIGNLIEEDMKLSKKFLYSSANLKGLKVEHSVDNFVEGRDVVLTLKDKGVLDADDDTLVNVNMLDDERYKKNIDRRKQKPGYNAYDDDEFDEFGTQPSKSVLHKYDEEIEGEKKTAFSLGVGSIEAMETARREQVRVKLQQQTGKRLESLTVAPLQLAHDYYTEEEINLKFKKPNKKVRKIRKPKPLKADDLLKSDVKNEPDEEEKWLRGIGTRRPNPSMNPIDAKPNLKSEPMDLDTDDLDAPSDLSNLKTEDNEEDDSELQIALRKARKLKQAEQHKQSLEKIVTSVKLEADADNTSAGGFIVLNETAEFCRTLGDIPTYGQAGNREDAPQLIDFEREVNEEKRRQAEKLSNRQGGWNEVEIDRTPVDIKAYEAPILDIEPDIGTGVAGALKLAVSKGYIERELQKRPSASKFAHLQAQNYSIEDKTKFIDDDKHAKRERYCGPTSDFKEKEGYKPNIKLEYIDDDGHLLCAKEAFRYLSHKFHGKGPGKNKIEKRMKKGEQEALMKQMSSTDTPLGTLNMLQHKQKETQSAFVVLSGSKHGQSTSISKLKL